ncbi:unnamed protein product [Nezara viridula]|uniref:Uncharacterized protein n=1 Tax=Nezara viridula TaxID=85310 RepID=A0A9P0HT29_NEZVI|nr:unnamed protein product [Nezara viridula]
MLSYLFCLSFNLHCINTKFSYPECLPKFFHGIPCFEENSTFFDKLTLSWENTYNFNYLIISIGGLIMHRVMNLKGNNKL